MCANTITDIIEELGKIQITDSHLAWQLKNLMDRLYVLEGIYNDLYCQHVGLANEEKERYTEEVFPSILSQCKKLSHYFGICPELRQNEQDINMLATYFQRYSKIVDRLLVKLQRAQSPKKISVFARIRNWFREMKRNMSELNELVLTSLNRIFDYFHLDKALLLFHRRTVVKYHRDSVDYVGSGYNLQPIQVLSLEYA